MYFQLSRDITRRIVELIYEISKYAVVICNDEGVVLDSAPNTGHLKEMRGNSDIYCERNIRVDDKIIGKVVIYGLGQTTELLTTLAAELIGIMVQERASCKDMYSLIHEYETIFNFVPAQIWYKDTKNNFIRVNKQVEKDLGIAVKAFPGRSAEELFPTFAEQYYRDDLAVITSGKPHLGIIEQINTEDNEKHWLSTNKVPTFNVDGSVSGVIALVRDITEDKKMEEQRSIWAKIFESSGEPMSVTDVDNKFVAVNQAFCDATGYSLHEVIGKDPRILKSGYHDEIFYQNMWAAINQVGSWQGKIWERRKK